MKIAIVNESTVLTTENVAVMAAAVAKQVANDWAPAWERCAVEIMTYGDLANVPPDASIVAMLDDATSAGILGYHDMTPDGRFYGKVFAKTVVDSGGTVSTGSSAVSVTLSHEVLELLGDAGANLWAFDGVGIGHALEMCDAVEADAYDADVDGRAVSVSNFVLPDYFDPGADGPYDFLRKLSLPLSLSAGGYEIVMKGGVVTQRFAASYPDWKILGKMHAASRTSKRAARGGAAVYR